MGKQLRFLGIDPGSKGGLSLYNHMDNTCETYALHHGTEEDYVNLIRQWSMLYRLVAMVEKVGSMPIAGAKACPLCHKKPTQGTASSFKFGKSAGLLEGALIALGIPRDFIRPALWQKHLSCLTGGDKNVSKKRAQQLWPGVKITHAIADAMLISLFCYKTNRHLIGESDGINESGL